jgi:membrane protease YdiL (CAAX protease family)
MAGLVVGLSLIFWRESIFGNRNANAFYPTDSLTRIVDRVLEFHAGISDAPAWRRSLYHVLQGSPTDFHDYAMKSYRDLLSFYAERKSEYHPVDIDVARTHLIILLAETNGHAEAQTELHRLRESNQEASLVLLLQLAYGRANRLPSIEDIDAASHYLAPGWKTSKLRSRLAANMGDVQLARDIETDLVRTGKRWERWVNVFLFVHLAIVASGLFLLSKIRYPPTEITRLSNPSQFTHWTLREGIGAFIWCLYLRQGLLLVGGFVARTGMSIPYQLLDLGTLLLSVQLIRLNLLIPKKLDFDSAFGLSVSKGNYGKAIRMAFAIFPLLLIGSTIIESVTTSLGFYPHWTEGLDEEFIWGSWQTASLSAAHAIVWGPILEELLVRGLLYPSLRNRFSPLVASLISSGVFASWHCYSIAGFLSVFWAGVVWAYAYERFRSLLPTILSHAAVNALLTGMHLVFFR